MAMSGWQSWETILDLALAEDIGTGDVTSLATIAPDAVATGVMLAKARGVISGMPAAARVFARVDPRIAFDPLVDDGTAVAGRTTIARISGPARGVLTGERVALNLLQRLSGVATLTAAYVAAVAGTRARIVDTRKTTPGLRVLEKAAVRHGGGNNHRVGLSDGVLIKDNHLAAVGGPDRIASAIRRARAAAPHTLKIEVEVISVAEALQAVESGADIVLLDNMPPEAMAEAVREIAGRALVEASGGVRLETVRAIAETGVDLISVGALTHSAPALDISLEFDIA
jgi:nicotinate-nucleotide pyrophosphorylase (carboxylating)